jgi:tripartite-type tricarboxylate transporter receptor subunit TctC
MAPRIVFASYTLVTVCLVSSGSDAQNYPSARPIRVVTSEVGGGNDFAARLMAPALSASLNQQIVIENRGGASGMIAGEAVAKAVPDGYTLLLYSGTIWLVPLLQKTPLDPVKDFLPISLIASSPTILVVHPSLPAKTAKELIALAKAKPGQLNYASVGTASGSHLSAELFKHMAGIDIVRIQYKGSALALNELLGGHTQLTFGTAGSTVPHVKSGRLRALAVTTAQPSEVFPGLPTVAGSGLPGYEFRNTYSFFAPLNTPSAIIDLLNQHIVQALKLPDIRDKFLKSGVDAIGTTPEQLAAAMKADIANMGKVIRAAGIRAD